MSCHIAEGFEFINVDDKSSPEEIEKGKKICQENDIVFLENESRGVQHATNTLIKFIKENLFNPHTGLWAETKQNTQFRENSQKWRGIIGVGFIGLVIEKVWSIFT